MHAIPSYIEQGSPFCHKSYKICWYETKFEFSLTFEDWVQLLFLLGVWRVSFLVEEGNMIWQGFFLRRPVSASEDSFEIGSKTFRALRVSCSLWGWQPLFGRVVKQNLGGQTCSLVYIGCLDNKLNISKYLGKCQKQVIPGGYVLKAPRSTLGDKGCGNIVHLRGDFCCSFLTLL